MYQACVFVCKLKKPVLFRNWQIVYINDGMKSLRDIKRMTSLEVYRTSDEWIKKTLALRIWTFLLWQSTYKITHKNNRKYVSGLDNKDVLN